jgi:8-oxo-dGTP pyrophosphatase MutT (NUDIX family)
MFIEFPWGRIGAPSDAPAIASLYDAAGGKTLRRTASLALARPRNGTSCHNPHPRTSNGEDMPTTIDQSWYERPPGTREQIAAGGIVVRAVGGAAHLALVREGAGLAYILPKGRLEPGETPEVAALREIEEEAGLTDLTLVATLGVRERFDFRKTHWKVTHYFLFRTEQVDGQPTDPNHAYMLEWFPFSELPPLFWPEQAALIHEHAAEIQALAAPG